LEILDKFAALGVKIRITEFDVDITDLQLQAQYLKDFLTIVYSHPAVVGFQMWGFWEGAHWRPNAALYDIHWNPRPAAETFRNLIWEEWNTQANGLTDDGGEFFFRGGFGEYAVNINIGDETFPHTIHLDKDDTLLVLPVVSASAIGTPKLQIFNLSKPQLMWNSIQGNYMRLDVSHDLLNWQSKAEFLNGPEGPVSLIPDDITQGSSTTLYRIIEN
jgi:hypothetical protein